MNEPDLPPVIWLSPECNAPLCSPDRMWCVEPMEHCEECGLQWIKYVLAPEAEQLAREVFEDEPIE